MTDPFRNYDRWKLQSPEDEEDEREQQREIDERRADKAEHDADLRQSGER
jgi:hypothetical protein